MQGLSALYCGQFGDVVPNSGSAHRIQSAIHMKCSKLQQDFRRRLGGDRGFVVIRGEHTFHHALVPSTLAGVGRRRSKNSFLDQTPEMKSSASGARTLLEHFEFFAPAVEM